MQICHNESYYTRTASTPPKKNLPSSIFSYSIALVLSSLSETAKAIQHKMPLVVVSECQLRKPVRLQKDLLSPPKWDR